MIRLRIIEPTDVSGIFIELEHSKSCGSIRKSKFRLIVDSTAKEERIRAFFAINGVVVVKNDPPNRIVTRSSVHCIKIALRPNVIVICHAEQKIVIVAANDGIVTIITGNRIRALFATKRIRTAVSSNGIGSVIAHNSFRNDVSPKRVIKLGATKSVKVVNHIGVAKSIVTRERVVQIDNNA